MAIVLEPNAEPIPGYRLIERLGHGGFGEVWKAEAPGGLLKAVKFVFGQIPGRKGAEENKAEREYKGLTRMKDIRHPFVLSMERFEIIEGRLIFVMELADRDLYTRLKECKSQGLIGIPRVELLKYLVEAAEALDLMNFQHEIQHLDIKPQNLFLVQSHVKVADFGLAKELEGFIANVTGGMTPMYAGPEIFGGKVSRNSDQYSLAVVYQELLTGRLPFPGPSPVQFMNQHLYKEPDLRPLPGCDQGIVRRALEKDPNRRFPTCREFVDSLVQAEKAATQAGYKVNGGDRDDASSPTRLGLETILGIDLGTTNSVIAVMDGKEPRVIPDLEGNRLTPSVVSFNEKGDRLVGAPAKRQATTNPTRTIHSVKRLMGLRTKEVAEERARVAYAIVGDAEQKAKVLVDAKEYLPPEISAMILRKLREAAEEYLGHELKKAVITVPAYFNDSQRQATKDAGQIAGLEVVRIINEPTAAALAYGLDKKKNQKIAVFDFGGGTFDITILRIRDGIFDVLATNGDTHLGGDDLDQRLVERLASDFEKEHGFDPRHDPTARQRLLEAAEKAKKELSSQSETEINLPFLAADESGPKHLNRVVSRDEFEGLCEELFERLKGPCLQALEDAKLPPADIDEVLLVGGSTRIPRVREIVAGLFSREPSKAINPDEAVAVGAAIHAGMLAGGIDDILLLDVTPLSLGIEVKGSLTSRIIDRNTTIPTIKKKVFSTAEDAQPEVGIHVVQGEREFAADNRSLAKFWLEGIRPAPAGTPQIEVTFNIDANGILDVVAKDLSNAIERTVRIDNASSLSPQEIERMRKEADEHADRDRRRRQFVDAKHAAAAALRAAEKQLKEITGLSDSNKKAIDKAMKDIRDAVDKEDAGRIPLAIWTLQQIFRAVQLEKIPRPEPVSLAR